MRSLTRAIGNLAIAGMILGWFALPVWLAYVCIGLAALHLFVLALKIGDTVGSR
jgi:uncharacterized membrane protein YuzA (DUF378 family)